MSDEHEQCIGKKLSDCPDGTVAVVSHFDCDREVRILDDAKAYSVGLDGNANEEFFWADTYTVHHILHLGTPRPKTLADEEPGVAWKDEDGFIHWRDVYGDACFVNSLDAYPKSNAGGASRLFVKPTWTRLGKIIGLRFEGE